MSCDHASEAQAKDRLSSRVLERAQSLGLTVAIAESLTGGLCAATLASQPGASRVLLGGMVTYATHLKASLLGVDVELLARKGPVDPEVARQMATGARRECTRDNEFCDLTALPDEHPRRTESAGFAKCVGISTTGVAGPDADPQTGQLPGTVWVGVSSSRGEQAYSHQFSGTRDEIREQTVAVALGLLLTEFDELASKQITHT